MEAITGALDRGGAMQPSTLVLVGEPGIGKSRLTQEAATRAAADGFAVRWGRAWEAGGAPPYWPWRQICDALDRTGPIAPLWGGASAGADPDQARFALFDAVTRALASASEAQPLLCIFDDLHAADVASLELLAFATRHMKVCRIVWLLTWRDAEGGRAPVRDALARIAREATVLPLGALSDSDANELIDDVRRDADLQLRGRLLRATGGNPLFLLETLAALSIGHVLAAELDELPLAHGIAAIVHDRLAPLPESTRQLAVAASAVGRDVGLDRWVAAASATAADARRAAQELVTAGLLAVLGRDRWRFCHDLVRDAIYRGAGDAVIECHRRLARMLDDASLIGERAHHGLLARGDARTILDWTIAAADHARGQCAYEEALSVIERTLAQLGSAAQNDPALALARGRALLDLGDATRANDVFQSALQLARSANDPRMVAAAVLGLGARWIFGDNMHELIALIDGAAAALPPGERELHARLLARKAAALTPAADPAPVLEIAREAQRLVEKSADAAARLEVAVAVGAAFTDFAPPRERIAVDETVVALARARGDRALELRGLTRLVADHYTAGNFAHGDAVLATRDALARSLVQPRFAWHEPLFRSMRAMKDGDFATCDTAVAEAETFAKLDPICLRACAIHRTWLYAASDRVDELRAHEPAVLAAIRTMHGVLATVIRAFVRFRAGELADARREVDALDAEVAHGRAPAILSLLAEVVAEVGPESMQRDIYDWLSPDAASYVTFGPFGLVVGPPVAAVLGNLAAAFGEPERARAHFESALAMTTASGAHAGRAWTLYWYGRALAKANVLDDAVREATRLGMPRLVERCAAVTTRAPAVTAAPAPAQPALAWSIAEQGGAWLIEHAGRKVLVPNLRGMAMLARLAARPHVEIHSLELVSGAVEAEHDTGDAGEVLDDKARAAYRKRVAQLADQIEEAEARGDVARAEAARDEHERLIAELSRAVGLGGKVRRSGAAGERARVAAHRCLRDAIKRIGEIDGELARHLTMAVRTGTFCAYRP